MNERRVQFKLFRGYFKTWETLFHEATAFADAIGREQVLSISHSSDNGEGVVVVWYWGVLDRCPGCGYDLTGNLTGRCPECGASL